MKVLHICSDYSNLYQELINREKKAIETEVFHFSWDGSRIVNESGVTSKICYRKIDRVFFILKEKKVVKEFEECYKNETFDIVHAHTLFSDGYIAYKNYLKRRTPYIVAVRNTDLNVFMKYRVFLRKLGCNILKNASRIIFLSPSYREQFVNKYADEELKGVLKRKSIIVPNGISDYFINNINYEGKNDFTGDCLKLLLVGEICCNKNQLMVCDLVDELNRRNINTSCKFIGKTVNSQVANKLKKRKNVYVLEPMLHEELIH